MLIQIPSSQESENVAFNDKVSIVMITHDRGEQIRTALAHLLQLRERPRIIVVDNGSTDTTAEAARTMRNAVDVIQLDQNLGGAGRNIGVLRAQTPYIAFSDDDSWWAPDALARAVELFEANPTLGLIAARILVGPEERLDPLCQVMQRSEAALQEHGITSNAGIPVVGFAACGAILRRSAFLEAGGFDRRLGVGGEEHILALDLLRNGWQLAYVDEIVAHHHPSLVRDPARRKRIEARNKVWSAWLRRPARTAWSETWRVIKWSRIDRDYRAGFAEAILGLLWVLIARNPIPVALDRQVKIAERVFYDSLGDR